MTDDNAPLTSLARIFVPRFVEDRCAQVASALTITTLLALVPIITVALTVASAFPVFESMIGHLQRFITNNVVPESVSVLASYAGHFSENAANLTAVGVLFLIVTALMLMYTIDNAFNAIWRVSRPRALLQRVLVYWMVLTTGPLFIGASLSFTSYLIRLSLGLIDNPPGVGLLLLRFASLLLTSAAFALLYFAIPNRRVRRRDALVGGVSAGLCFEAMNQGLGFYIANFPTYTLVYGAFAAVPIFLLWIYMSWLIILGGAVLTAVMPEWRERTMPSQTVPGGNFLDALQILKLLWRAQRAGGFVSIDELRSAARMRLDHLEGLLNTLAGANWIARSGAETWMLSRSADTISLDDVYRLLVFRGAAPARPAEPQLDALAQGITARIADHMQMSIAEAFSRTEAGSEAGVAGARVNAA